MKKADLGYTAGIIDGEGCICIFRYDARKVKTRFGLTITVDNTNEWLCQWLKFNWGGYVTAQQGTDNKSPLWIWAIRGEKSAELL